MVKEIGVRAPKAGAFKGRAAGVTSFATYFLRDLYLKGKINADLIGAVAKENGIEGRQLEDITRILESPDSTTITPAQHEVLQSIAVIVADQN